MDAVRVLLEAQPLFTLFLTIALGYVVGELSIKGVSLGSGAVLFVGLAIGGFTPKAAPPALIGTLGLLLFLYGIGIQYGGQFFEGLTSARGLKANAAAALGVVGAGLISLALAPLFGVGMDASLGIFAGAGTSTATLQAIIAATKGDGAAVGYSVAYPFGVAGPILCLYCLGAVLKAKVEAPPAKVIELAEISLRNREIIGLTIAELKARLPAGLSVAAVRREHHNQLPTEDLSCGQTMSCLRRPRIRRCFRKQRHCWESCSQGESAVIGRTWTMPGYLHRAARWSGWRCKTSAFPTALPVRLSRCEGAMPTCCPGPI
ncbi:hypothetical protein Tamer19_59690 [Cupriavidus sp. TA19]|nr:hypothetical protein Tamer19_59690 [Cupriavidus sp. TA19]